VTADTLVVDVAPKFAVILGVGDGDFLTRIIHGVAGQIQLTGVDVEQLDVVEDPLDVVDHPTHRRSVAVSRPQRRHAPPQATDELVKLGEFSSAGQRISLTDKGVMDHITALDNIQHTAMA
jgi:hypothetical protein